MAERRVSTPEGQVWNVRRRWVPRLGQETLWQRFRRRIHRTFERATEGAEADPGCLADFGEGLVAGVAILLFVLFLVFVAVPLLVAVVDVLIVLLLAALGVLARVVLRRPWVVEARSGTRTVIWRVVGWRASGEQRDRVAEWIASTGTVPPEGTELA